MQVRSRHETPIANSRQQEDTYHDAVRHAAHIILRGYLANPAMRFSVFIHKAESLSEDYRDGECAGKRLKRDGQPLTEPSFRELW